MEDISKSTIDNFLKQVAKPNTTPASGSVAALTSSLAVSLIQMVVNSKSSHKNALPEDNLDVINTSLSSTSDLVKDMITDDSERYNALLEARKSNKDEKSIHDEEVNSALRKVIDLPFRLLLENERTLQLITYLLDAVSHSTSTDLYAAATNLYASSMICWANIVTNINEKADDKSLQDVKKRAKNILTNNFNYERLIQQHTMLEQ